MLSKISLYPAYSNKYKTLSSPQTQESRKTVTKLPNFRTKEQPHLSKTEKLMRDVRKMPLFNQSISLETAVGGGIPRRKDNKVYIILPFYGCYPQKGVTKLFPPFATITLDWSNQVPVEYVNLRFRNPAPELNWEGEAGTFPHPALSQMTVGQYLERRRELHWDNGWVT
jgi:hypothetical protein